MYKIRLTTFVSLLSLLFITNNIWGNENITPPNNQIWYTSRNGIIVNPTVEHFGVPIISNTYENGIGIITFARDITEIGLEVFMNCFSLTSVVIPSSVIKIGESAFNSCYNLSSIDLPNTVTSIGESAFAGCLSLNTIIIPNSVHAISLGTFYGCSSLNSIEIPSTVSSIGDWAFYECSSLKSIEIPSTVSSIGNMAFYYCSSLKSIEIPSTVLSIGDMAFYYCSSLKSIEIPSTVLSIGDMAFAECSNLNSIIIEDGNPKYDSRNNCNAIIETETNTLIKGCQNTVIPNSVTKIGDNAFSDCSGLTSITIPGSITSIGEYAFAWCPNLSTIEIPNSVTKIGYCAFYECPGLTSISVEADNPVYDSRNNCNAIIKTETNTLINGCTNTTIPNSVIYIGDIAFAHCTGLTSLFIPKSVTGFHEHAFYDCPNLVSIIIDDDNPVYDSRNNCNAIIKTETNTLIKGCQNTVIPNSVTKIGDNAFSDCSGLTSITIPGSITSIGDMAFSYCSSLKSIEIPNSVTKIGGDAFFDCPSLISVKIPSSITSIGSSAFGNCCSLSSIIVERGNPVYDSRNNCNAIIETKTNTLIAGCYNTIIPSSVKSIGDYAFYGCTGLTNIDILYSEFIGDYAFCGCTNVTTVTIQANVFTMGACAFGNCSSLSSVICDMLTPPSMSGVFGNLNVILYVPDESIEDYIAQYKFDFLDILPISSYYHESGINNTHNRNTENGIIYNINGIPVNESEKGILIQNGKLYFRQ